MSILLHGGCYNKILKWGGDGGLLFGKKHLVLAFLEAGKSDHSAAGRFIVCGDPRPH